MLVFERRGGKYLFSTVLMKKKKQGNFFFSVPITDGKKKGHQFMAILRIFQLNEQHLKYVYEILDG